MASISRNCSSGTSSHVIGSWSSYRNVPEIASCASSAETSGGSHPQPGSLKPWPSAVPPAFPRDAANAAMIDCNMLQLQLQLHTATTTLHYATLHYTNYITYITLRYNYNYTTLHYTTLDHATLYQPTVHISTQHISTLHYTTLITPHHNYNCNYTILYYIITLHYNYNSTELHYNYNYNCITPHYIQQLW